MTWAGAFILMAGVETSTHSDALAFDLRCPTEGGNLSESVCCLVMADTISY